MDGLDDVRARLVRADEIAKAAPAAADPGAVRERARQVLVDTRDLLDGLRDRARTNTGSDGRPGRDDVDEAARQVSRRMLDLDGADLAATTVPPEGMRRAPTSVDDPHRRPPNQHLTPGFPVLHVGSPPPPGDPDEWTVTLSGRVVTRCRWSLGELRADPAVTTTTADFHCVTGWSRLDNDWTGLPLRVLLDRAGARPEATHALVYGHPAYSANLSLPALRADDVVVAWAHDGEALSSAHGGPLRLVVPARYGWKSVKWVTEVRLVDRDVAGYWEERGYHMHADPWREQRLDGD